MTFVKNSETEIEITGMTSEGNGVGRVDNMTVFVPETAVGDVVKVRIIKVCKNYLYGKVIDIIKESESRIVPDCDVFRRCGGCSYRHISYENECEIKYLRVADCLKHIAKTDLIPENIIPCENIYRYRNKAQLPVGLDENGNVRIGFYAPRSHRITDCRDCKLQPIEFGKIAEIIVEYIEKYKVSVYNEMTGKGIIRHLYIRKGFESGEIMVCLVINGESLPERSALVNMLTERIPNIKSILVNVNIKKSNVIMGEKCHVLFGKEVITDVLCGVKFMLSPLSFYQVNHAQATRLFEKAMEFADPSPDDILLDLCCGTGAIGLIIAKNRHLKKLIGVEIVPQAVEDAIKNAENNNINNAEFICDDASGAAKTLSNRGEHPDIVVIDPPRKGCDKSLIDIIAQKLTPSKIVYVSCDPSTLARDVVLFEKQGYKLKKAVPVDMFPRTPHVETVCLLSKLNAKQHIEINLSMD